MPELKFLNWLDYSVLGLYMILVMAVGIYVSRFNKNTSDYFKGDGHIPWRLSGISLFISGFSAFMFVGAAGITYNNGGGAIILFSLALPSYLFGYYIYGPLWRRTRLDTPLQFLSRRFSPSTTYFYTVLAVFPNVLILGIWIYMLCIFVSTALGFNDQVFDLWIAEVNGFQLTLIVTGLVMTIYTLMGGLWAVMVTDALQFLIVFVVTLVVLPVAYIYLGDGSLTDGVQRLFTDAPEGYFGITLEGQPPLFWIAYMISLILGYNVNWHIAQRYYSVPDERDTKKMALWCAGLSFILPMMWILPVMASRILFPDIDAMWPGFTKPAEASFVTLALAILPHGILGVMVAGIFAATMSSADSTLNWLGAVLTKDIYVPVRRRFFGSEAGERGQLWFGKTSVAVMGLFAIWAALSMERFGGAFDVYLRADSIYKSAMFIPVIFGLVYTKTPWWSAMVAFGLGVVGIFGASVLANWSLGLPASTFADVFVDIRITFLGMEMTRYEINTLSGIIVTTVVFFTTALFNKREGAFKKRIEAFEEDLATPAYADAGIKYDTRGIRSFILTGQLAIVIGVILLVMVIPTWNDGALINFLAGVLSVVIGATVIYIVRNFLQHETAEPHPESK